MENKRKSQIAIIAVLAVAVVALGVGFAAFSTALTITSSASVTPDSSTFRVVFADSQGTYNPITAPNSNPVTIAPQLSATVQNFTATDATINNTATHSPEITGLSANFTAPGQSVTYTFKVKNIGEYDAFLNSIDFQNATQANSNKVCTANTDSENGNAPLATDTYVQEACGLISLSVQIHGSTFTTTSTPSPSPKLDKSGTNSESTVVVTIAYAAPNTNADGYTTAGAYGRADGPFTVAFGDIQLNYSTVANTNS